VVGVSVVDRAPLTRTRVVRAALDFVDAHGIEALSMRKLGQQLGVEAMSLYNHVESKDDLVAEACAAGVVSAREAVLGVASRAAPADRVHAVLDAYLTAQRRDSAGCTLATLGGEIARQPAAVRARFTEELTRSVEAIAPLMDGVDEQHRGDQVIAMVASMVGAMMLSRAVSDPKVSQRILEVGRRAMGGAVERAGRPTERRPAHQTPGKRRQRTSRA
jgi:TetR/AcrR family transcriptional repressor of nem operon